MGTLYVVATPIGNLEDITLRALRILREVQLIAAEDTRRTAKLLQHYSIVTPTTSLHEHNEAAKTESLLGRLREGAAIALVSDAGTPLVSDPGRHFVRMARREGHAVVAIPGASAVMTILAAAGLDVSEFVFLGFPPRKANALEMWIAANLRQDKPTVFFEAPHRIRQTLASMHKILGDRPIIVGRELTKLHEELVEQPISEHLGRLAHPRGEFTILVEQPIQRPDQSQTYPGDAVAVQELGYLVNSVKLQPRAAARQVALRYGVGVNTIYRLWAGSKR